MAVSACARPPEPSGDPFIVDDVSRLNATRVSRNLSIPSGDLEKPVGDVVRYAGATTRPLCIAGARHSMGGQSLPPEGGVALQLGSPDCRVAPSLETYSVSGGARWKDVVPVLDRVGRSPLVTQANNDFSVGGSISVNAHGWAVPFGPVGDTVRRLRLMLADGSVIPCSPDENPELFALVLGGYGLFGVVLEAELACTPNLMLERTQARLPARDFAAGFVAAVRRPEVRMAYGRLSLSRKRFLRDSLLITHPVAHEQPLPLPEARAESVGGLGRRLFRNQTGSDAGKTLRWWAETRLQSGEPATRNSLMNAPSAGFAPFNDRRVDILHEYFVPPAGLEPFLAECRRIIPAFDQDLLNVTLRWVEADRRSVLAFAPESRIALVILFSQGLSAADDADMRALTQRLIDAALAMGGSYYLPYRLHARPDQLRRAYPRLDAFVEAKRRLDPDLRFRNHLWDTALATL